MLKTLHWRSKFRLCWTPRNLDLLLLLCRPTCLKWQEDPYLHPELRKNLQGVSESRSSAPAPPAPPPPPRPAPWRSAGCLNSQRCLWHLPRRKNWHTRSVMEWPVFFWCYFGAVLLLLLLNLLCFSSFCSWASCASAPSALAAVAPVLCRPLIGQPCLWNLIQLTIVWVS